MSTPLSPGVYVREAPGGPRAIEGVPTGVAIFVGETERGPLTPTAVTSRLDYTRLFGGYLRARSGGADPSRVLMPYAMDGFFGNGGPRAYVLRTADENGGTAALAGRTATGGADTILVASSPGIWGNSVSVAINDALDADPDKFRLLVFYQAPGATAPTLVERWEGLSAVPAEETYAVTVLRRSLYIRWNEAFAVAKPANDAAASQSDADMAATAVALAGGEGGGDDLDVADYAPPLDALREISDAALIVNGSDKLLTENGFADDDYINLSNTFIDYVATRRPQLDLFFVGDVPRFTTETDPVAAVADRARATVSPGTTASDFCSVYWPHIRVGDPAGEGANPEIVLPPAGHIAGLYGRTDSRRGVWKAPAGVETTIAGVRALDFLVLDVHQDTLNPLGINAIRRIPNAGMVVWGARTRMPATQWRYVPVRRTAMFLRKAIFNGIQWAVFEPNDERLWASLRATIGAFMETQFRNGAFAGATSREAYFVKCDADTTTPDDQAAGVVNVLVGFAPLRPAEFVIVTLSQKAGQTA
jgi:phage tail sheath protein FI